MARELLEEDALTDALANLNGWTVEQGKLHKEYVFEDFVHAFAFMTAAALCAERKNHHPEWYNVYRTVRVDLSTHDLGGISTWDVELARELDALAQV
jgi:4a-hydroxytetrahydrobiopterin dehydratase